MKIQTLLINILFFQQAHASNFNQFFSSASNTNSGRLVFSRDTTWTVPTGVTKINIQITGGGGGGSTAGGGAGGGGGGSCIKNGATTLASADGGRGAHYNEIQAAPGLTTYTSLAVTGGTSLSVYIGGGGGGGGAYPSSPVYYGGAGGYGYCGNGGVGGNTSGSVSGGSGGADKGGGGGAGYTGGSFTVGGNAASSTGGTGVGGALGGSALVGGVSSNKGGGGGASGGGGGIGYIYSGYASIYGTNGSYASRLTYVSGSYFDNTYFADCSSTYSSLGGSPGINVSCGQNSLTGAGGGGGEVVITW